MMDGMGAAPRKAGVVPGAYGRALRRVRSQPDEEIAAQLERDAAVARRGL
jgi:hypothetical protein